MKKGIKVFRWIFFAFCLTSILAYGITIPSVLMALLGIISLPIEAIEEKWEDIPFYRVIQPISIGILFCILIVFLPSDQDDNSKSIEQEVVSETSDIEEIALANKEEVVQSIEEPAAKKEIKKDEELEETTVSQEKSEVLIVPDTSSDKVAEKTEEAQKATSVNVSEEYKEEQPVDNQKVAIQMSFSLSDVPAYSGKPYVEINENVPYFTDGELKSTSYEFYSNLDGLGRCGVVHASIGRDLMPTEERESIGNVKPTGWKQNKYNGLVDGNYIYNRCHLIGFQLSGENANERNLITGTRYLNTEGMLPFENMVADYVQETGNHVMYRVTPIFDGDNLLASGVLMEAKSVEDHGDGILFNVFCYNVQPGININYSTGENSLAEGQIVPDEETDQQASAPIAVPVVTQEQSQPEQSQPEQPVEVSQPVSGDNFAVNNKNGKIHMVGGCNATENGNKNAMKEPIYFNTYEEAEAYSIQAHPGQDKRQCGNCW